MNASKEFLEIEKIREDIETELARRHNWAQQEEYWRSLAKYTSIKAFAAVAAVAASFGGIAVALFMLAFNLTKATT